MRPELYNFSVLLFIFCMLGIIMVYDLFGIFIFVEITIGAAIILVAHAPNKISPEAAFKYLILTAISALFVLLGVLIVYILSGTSNLFVLAKNPGQLAQNPHLLMLAVACFVVGLGADIGLVPFHGWVPDVWPASTPVVNGFSCAEPLALVFGLHKLVSPMYNIYPTNTIIIIVGGVGLSSIAVGTLLAYRQTDFWRTVGYLTIEEFGKMVLILGLFTPDSFLAGQMLLVNSSLMKTGVVLSLGSVQICSNTSDLTLLGGLAEKMKKTMWGYLICALSLAGIPPLSGFYAKWFFYDALYSFLLTHVGPIASILVILLVSISLVPFVIILQVFHSIFFGKQSHISERTQEAPISMWFPALALAFTAVIWGLQPNLLMALIRP
ncbi:MAG: proton-conducting transporter membrane subunit [Candidatus Bathyarchaeia archaeon]